MYNLTLYLYEFGDVFCLWLLVVDMLGVGDLYVGNDYMTLGLLLFSDSVDA